MDQKKEHSNLIKKHLKKRGITQTWLAKELKQRSNPPLFYPSFP